MPAVESLSWFPAQDMILLQSSRQPPAHQMELSMKTVTLLATLFTALTLLAPHPCRSAGDTPQDIARTLTMKGWYKAATPAQVRALVKGRSLAGVRAEGGKYGKDPAYTPLMRAAEETPWPEVIDILIQAGCKVNDTFELRVTWRSGDDDVSTALHLAVYNPKPGALRALLRHKPDLNARADLNSYSYTALELAAQHPGKAEHLRALLEAGARPVAPDKKYSNLRHSSLWSLFLGLDNHGISYRPMNALNYAR